MKSSHSTQVSRWRKHAHNFAFFGSFLLFSPSCLFAATSPRKKKSSRKTYPRMGWSMTVVYIITKDEARSISPRAPPPRTMLETNFIKDFWEVRNSCSGFRK